MNSGAKYSLLLVAMVTAGTTGGCHVNWRRDHAAHARSGRPWARPLEAVGVPNLHRIDDGLYRSAQPDEKGMATLEAMGIKTVVNLRVNDSDGEDAAETSLACVNLPINAYSDPDAAVVSHFLQIVREPIHRPILIHCRAGADRTGMMCAIYRVAVQGWSKSEAIDEWTEGGFGYHEAFDHFVEYFQELDIARAVRAPDCVVDLLLASADGSGR